MVFSDSKHIQSNLVGLFDLLDQVTEPLRRAERPARFSVRCRETIDAYLNVSLR
jgi:hypothetical protein